MLNYHLILNDTNYSLRWRHNGRVIVSNYHPHVCLFRRRSKKTSKLRVTGLCAGNSPRTCEFPAQMASYAENVSIWWRHHDEPNIIEEMATCYMYIHMQIYLTESLILNALHTKAIFQNNADSFDLGYFRRSKKWPCSQQLWCPFHPW